MSDVIVIKKQQQQLPRLSNQEIDDIYTHLVKGGSPLSTSAVTGISTERLMQEYTINPEFRKTSDPLRAQTLARLEYILYENAVTKRDSDTIMQILQTNMPEVYLNKDKKMQDKVKSLLGRK